MKRILAIDFGTNNTYFSVTTIGGSVIPCNFFSGGDNDKGIDSACLRFTKGSHQGQIAIGKKALNYYGGASDDDIQSAGMVLATNFKPDIEISEDARQNSICFLKEALKLYQQNDKTLNPLEMDVIFGVPSEASETYKRCLAHIAREAGYGNIRLLDEPFGALSSYQDECSDEAVEAMINDSVLVVDFGGGTCDFAILQKGKILHSWGDMLLGGRLFDDLFYEWILDQIQKTDKTKTEQSLIENNEDYYVRTVQSRQFKEEFSEFTVKFRNETFDPFFDNRYHLSMTWDEFMRRAAAYTPSESFKKRTRISTVLRNTRFTMSGTIDLIGWFRDELRRGFVEKNIPFNSIQKTLLAGGSSKWAFSRDICSEILPQSQIVDCENVFAAISMGLAKYAVIKRGAENKYQKLLDEKDKFINSQVEMIESSLTNVDRIKDIANTLFNEFALPKMKQYRQDGGKISDMESQIRDSIKNNTAQIKEILQPLFENNGMEFDLVIPDRLKKWFKDCGISPKDYSFGTIKFNVSSFISQNPDFWAGDTIAQALSSSVTDVLLTFLTLNGLLKSTVTTLFGKKTTEDFIKKTDFSWFKSALTDSEIERIRKNDFIPKFTDRFLEFTRGFVNKNKNVICKLTREFVESEVEKYKKVIDMETEL